MQHAAFKHRQLTYCFDYFGLQHYPTEQVALTYRGFTKDYSSTPTFVKVEFAFTQIHRLFGACINTAGVDF